MNHNDLNTQKHFLRKGNIKRVLTPIAFTLLLYTQFNLKAGNFEKHSIEDHITDSDLVFYGILVDKSTQLEKTNSVVLQRQDDGSFTKTKYTGNSVMTTFVFKVNEIYKGSLDTELIEVKMYGGCLKDRCNSVSYNYDFKLDKSSVLFLRKDKNNDYYKATSGAYSAFKVINNKLFRKSEAININEESLGTIKFKNNIPTIDDLLTIEILKEVSLKMRGKNENL